ncbi:MAG: four helix bundle protein [Verrucomicrobiota bacterium]
MKPELMKRQNLNRHYMRLETWQRGMDLFELVFKETHGVTGFKLRSQITDAAQSVAANIAEGYCRRTLPEYLQFLYTAKGSLGECLTQALGLLRVGLLTLQQFEKIDVLHYEVENKLLGLIRSLEAKRADHSWDDPLPPAHHPPSTIHHPPSLTSPP